MSDEQPSEQDWQIPEAFAAHLRRPHNLRDNPGADGAAELINGCSERLGIWIEVEGDRIARAGFTVQACLNVAVSGSATAALAEGREVSALKTLSEADVMAELGGLPPGEEHCARFALETLRAAVLDYLDKRREEPWKRLYR